MSSKDWTEALYQHYILTDYRSVLGVGDQVLAGRCRDLCEKRPGLPRAGNSQFQTALADQLQDAVESILIDSKLS